MSGCSPVVSAQILFCYIFYVLLTEEITAAVLQNGHQSVNEMKSLVHSAADAKRMQMGLAERLAGGKSLQGRQAKAVAAGAITMHRKIVESLSSEC